MLTGNDEKVSAATVSLLNSLSREPLNLPECFTITCHAGALDTPENKLEGMKSLVRSGAAVVEMDVSFRPDGTPCTIHKDAPGLNEGDDFDAMLSAVAESDSCMINLDLKAWHNLPEVDRLVKKHGLLSRVFYTGVGRDRVEQVRTTSVIPYYLNASVPADKRNDPAAMAGFAKEMKEMGALGLNTQFLNVSKTVVSAVHDCGLLVSAWTANDRSTQCQLLALGVDNITTLRPDVLKECIELWGKF